MDLQHYMDESQHFGDRNRQLEMDYNALEQMLMQSKKQL